MKKIIKDLLEKYFDEILANWSDKLSAIFGERLSDTQLKTFAESTLKIYIELVETSDYESADQYLIDSYNLFSGSNLNLLEISQIYSQGRYSITAYLEKDRSHDLDPLILMSFMDELIEQIYARYGMIHQKAQMQQLEADRDRLASKLELNQQYLSNILRSSDSAIIVIDNNEKFIAWNKGAENIFGYKEEEVIGKSSSLLLPKDEKYLSELDLIKERVNEKGFIKLEGTERVTKNGNIVSVDLSVAKLPNSNGEYSGRTVIIKDYTEVKKLQQQIDQSEKLAVIGQLAAGVAHEIGNPLTSISALVQLLQRKTEDEFTSEQLATIKENIERITKIVRELVDFSRPPSHEKMLININDIVRTALGIVKYDKRVKKVDFIQRLDHNIPKINTVPDQLLQVFVNILINALDATSGDGIIKVDSKLEGEFVSVVFSDDGHGMDSETLEQIFDPFFTTKDVGKGTGLGLSVSYGIIKKFGGDIIAESRQGEGSTFTVKLPTKEIEIE
jgi:PAS domain S-box-containing protein